MPFIILNFITIVVVAVVADVMNKSAKMLTLEVRCINSLIFHTHLCAQHDMR